MLQIEFGQALELELMVAGCSVDASGTIEAVSVAVLAY